MITEQLTLPLLEEQRISFEDILKLHPNQNISILLNSRLKRNWFVRISSGNKRELTIPGFFSEAPSDVKTALIEWAALPLTRRNKKPEVLRAKRNLETVIWSYVEQIQPPRTHHAKFRPEVLETNTFGCKYDLKEVFDSVNATFFENKVKSFVRWGTVRSTTSFQTSKVSSDKQKFNVITIAGVYNHPDVPRFALEAVMYHEMLHIVIPPYRLSGRNVVHGKEFRTAERKFPHFIEWVNWEKSELPKIARSIRRKHHR